MRNFVFGVILSAAMLFVTAPFAGEEFVSPEVRDMLKQAGRAWGVSDKEIDRLIEIEGKRVISQNQQSDRQKARKAAQDSPEIAANAAQIRQLLNRMKGSELYGGTAEDTDKFVKEIADDREIARVLDKMSKRLHVYAEKEGIDINQMTQQDVTMFVADNITMSDVNKMLSGKIEFSEEDFQQGLEVGSQKDSLDDLLRALQKK